MVDMFSMVPIEEFEVVGNEAEAVVIEQMTYLKEKADDALEKMEDALDDLKQEITSASMPTTNIDYDYVDETIEPDDIEHLRPDTPDFPNTNDVDPPELLQDWLNVPLPVFEDVPSFSVPEPDDEFTYDESQDDYQSSLTTALQSSLLDWITNGGTGLSTTVEEAMFTRARLRLTEAWELAFENADTFHSSRAFNIPTGPKNSLLRRVNADFERKEEDLNQKILQIQAELAQNNTQFAHTISVEFEKNLRDHFNTVATRLLDAAKATVTLLYDIYAKKVQAYVAHVQGVATAIDAEAKKVDVQVAINKGTADVYVADTTRFRTEIDAVLGVIDGQAKVYAAEVNGYRADIDLEKAEMDAAVERLKALISQSSNQTDLQIKEAEVDLQAYISSLGLNIEVSKTIADILAQIAASSLSAINTHAGLTDTASRSYSGKIQFEEQLQKTGSYIAT